MNRTLDIIKKYNLSTKKKFGQNFLVDEFLLDKIVSVAGNINGKNILEIGPGPGGLTYSILKKNPKKLLSVEIDEELEKILKVEFSQKWSCLNFILFYIIYSKNDTVIMNLCVV